VHRQIILLSVLVFSSEMIVFAAPPVPALDPNEPGLHVPYTGDPDTIEDACAQDGPRHPTLGYLNECENWDFLPVDYGDNGWSDDGYFLTASPFSQAGAACLGEGKDLCGAMRYTTTFKDTPAPDAIANQGHPMRTDIDWVFSVDFTVDTAPGDTFGGDKLIELISQTGGDMLTITGASDKRASNSPRTTGSFFNGEPNRYKVRYGPAPEGSNGPSQEFIIPGQLSQGSITLHYKASNQRLDLWLDDTKLIADFESYNGHYDLDFIQLAGGGTTFENVLFDNVLVGVRAENVLPIPGDANGDGVVDVADLGILGANFGMTDVVFDDGDFNGDNVVDVADLGILGANWSAEEGLSLSQALRSAGFSPLIPEPATVAVLAVGLVCLVRRR